MTQSYKIPELLEPFGLSLSADQTDRLLVYLELLLKWNAKINLVGKSRGEECLTRHFGESLYLSRLVDLTGKLLDIGSGAGFPGLPLKIVCPSLEVTLLEPIAKKRAFLKEVVRICQLDGVIVLGSRLEDFYVEASGLAFDFATSRAVGGLADLVENAADCLEQGGKICLWLGHDDAASILGSKSRFSWHQPLPIPLSLRREILIGDLEPGQSRSKCFT